MARKSRTVVRRTCELERHGPEAVLGSEGDHGAPEIRVAKALRGVCVRHRDHGERVARFDVRVHTMRRERGGE
jgi:hypothetical protein